MRNLLVVTALLLGSSALADHHEKKAPVDCSKLTDAKAKADCEAKAAKKGTEKPAAPAEKPAGH